MSYRLILAVSYDDSPALQITDHQTSLGTVDALIDSVILTDDQGNDIFNQVDDLTVGSAVTVKDDDTDEPVAYIIRTA